MKEKLDYLLKSKGLSSSTLARMLEIQPSGISHLLSGRNKPSFDLVVKILRVFPDINPDWLLLDKGDMTRGSEPLASPTSDEVFDATRPAASLFDESQNKQISESSDDVKNEQTNIFPIPSGSTKIPRRVIVLYDDGSFDSFTASLTVK